MLELINISYKIKDSEIDKVILEDISCKFEDKKITAITGHNGSGKSTLTKIIMGIIAPTSGKIIFDGTDITDFTPTDRARLGLTYAFQTPVTFKGITIKELIDIASNSNNTISDACAYLSKVGLCTNEYLFRDFDKTLSGGEQKRIELALTLAKISKCAIFDEPEAGIDLWSFEKLSAIFNPKITNIIVSHQSRLLERADNILVLEHGRIKEYSDSKTIMKRLNQATCKNRRNKT